MFSPIKKIFTYIQKNASSSNMFGISTQTMNTGASAQKKSDSETMAPQSDNEVVIQTESDIVSESNGTLAIELVETNTTEPLESKPYNDNHDDSNDAVLLQDDIELQIKPSIMVRKDLLARRSSICRDIPLPHDHNQNTKQFAEVIELENPIQSEVKTEPVTAQPDVVVIDDDVEEIEEHFLNTTDEDLEAQYLELDAFENNDIIDITEPQDSPTDPLLIVSTDYGTTENVSPLKIKEDTKDVDANAVEYLPVDAGSDMIWLQDDDLPAASQENNVEIEHIAIESQPKINHSHEETAEELRCDGDSGLGSETSALQTSLNSTVSPQQTLKVYTNSTSATLQAVSLIPSALKEHKPTRSNLKRRSDTDALDDLNVNTSSSLQLAGVQQKRAKRTVHFDNVQIFYFQRQQGFGCVPTVGGCTLGMGAMHIASKTLSLAEHAAELRRAHRMQDSKPMQVSHRGSSSDDTEESEEDYVSDSSGSDPDGESNGYLAAVSPKNRRALLKAAGVRKIDATEKFDCRDIRNSRDVCGCSCREFCDPETCACSQMGIKCQVDRSMFPCGCTREACGNPMGRIEFNPGRVRTHYIHTIMRLDMEQRQQQNPTNLNYALAVNATSTAVTNNYYASQSNYSSGYASPAYTAEACTSFYQTPQQQQQLNEQAQSAYELQTSQYHIDSLDAGLFTDSTNATPSYGELMTTSPTRSYTHNLSELNQQSQQLNTYATYQQNHDINNAYAAQTTSSTFSSCAVPSVPPHGNATTTAANAQYLPVATLETTPNVHSNYLTATSSCNASSTLSEAERNFIDMNTPNVDSLHLEHINELIRLNRNAEVNNLLQINSDTTVTLLTSPTRPTRVINSSSSSSSSTPANSSEAISQSIDTPPIEDAHKSCLAFEELPPPLVNPTPIVAFVERPVVMTPKPIREIVTITPITSSSSSSTSSSSTTTTSSSSLLATSPTLSSSNTSAMQITDFVDLSAD